MLWSSDWRETPRFGTANQAFAKRVAEGDGICDTPTLPAVGFRSCNDRLQPSNKPTSASRPSQTSERRTGAPESGHGDPVYRFLALLKPPSNKRSEGLRVGWMERRLVLGVDCLSTMELAYSVASDFM